MEDNSLLEYIKKVKDIGELLARAVQIETYQGSGIGIDRRTILEDGIISVVEFDWDDPIECSYYNELASIERIIEEINAMSEEEQEDIANSISTHFNLDDYDDNFVKEYGLIMKRLKTVLNDIVMKLCLGLKVYPKEPQLYDLIEESQEDEEYGYDEQEPEYEDSEEEPEDEEYDDIYEEDNDTGRVVIFMQRIDEGKNNNSYMVYDIKSDTFKLYKDDEKIAEKINVGVAMEITLDYLYRMDKEKRREENEKAKM